MFGAWWILGGLYARRQAVLRNLQEQPGRIQAAIKGPIWVREMLIWSTLPPRDFNPERSTAEVSERSRNVITGPATPAIKEVAGWEPPVDKGLSGGGAAAPLTTEDIVPPAPVSSEQSEPAILPEPALVSEPVSLPEPVLSQDPALEPEVVAIPEPVLEQAANETIDSPVVVPPKKLPKQPKKKGSVKALCPWCDKKRKYQADAVCSSCHNPNPWLVGHWGLGAAPVQDAVIANVEPQPVEEAVLLVPAGAQKPKRLPGKPMLGTTLKSLCPWCNSQQKYKADAVCPSCHNQNPWLAEKWKLKISHTSIDVPVPAQIGPGSDAVLPQPNILPVVANKEDIILPEPALTPSVPEADEVIKDTILPEPVINSDIPEPEIKPEPVAEAPKDVATPAPSSAQPSGNCSGCGRKAMPDLDDNCMFCGNHLGGAA